MWGINSLKFLLGMWLFKNSPMNVNDVNDSIEYHQCYAPILWDRSIEPVMSRWYLSLHNRFQVKMDLWIFLSSIQVLSMVIGLSSVVLIWMDKVSGFLLGMSFQKEPKKCEWSKWWPALSIVSNYQRPVKGIKNQQINQIHELTRVITLQIPQSNNMLKWIYGSLSSLRVLNMVIGLSSVMLIWMDKVWTFIRNVTF